MGEKFDKKKGEILRAWRVSSRYPRNMRITFGLANEEAILQVQFVGPGGIDYINPADDPRKK